MVLTADVGGEHLQRLLLAALTGRQPRPLLGAEPLPTTGPQLHLLDMAEFQKPGDQMRRDAAGLRPDPIVKSTNVHDDVP